DAMLEQTGNIDLIGRYQSLAQFGPGASQGYHFRVTSANTWSLFKETSGGTDTTLASGSHAFGTNAFHRLSLTFNGTGIQASIDGTRVANVSDGSFGSGHVGFLVSKWKNAQFDNFTVAPAGGGDHTTTQDDAVQGPGTNPSN